MQNRVLAPNKTKNTISKFKSKSTSWHEKLSFEHFTILHQNAQSATNEADELTLAHE